MDTDLCPTENDFVLDELKFTEPVKAKALMVVTNKAKNNNNNEAECFKPKPPKRLDVCVGCWIN